MNEPEGTKASYILFYGGQDRLILREDKAMPNQPDSSTQPIPSELVKQDPDFADLVEDFIGGLATRLETMEQAAQQHNFESVRTCAHQLKGAAGGYGYPCLTEKAGELEQQAVAQTLEECARSIDELKNLISRVVVA